MAASPNQTDGGDLPPQDKWSSGDDKPRESTADNGTNGGPPADDHAQQGTENADYARSGSAAGDGADGLSAGKSDSAYRGEKQVKVLITSPNKVYIGGLPEHTRKEDLESCFGKIGNILNIELKVGYGFVEFDNREAAEESVAKYHEGYFMGNKIRVELSHGGGRTAKYNNEPGACFKCGQMGHWARECPNSTTVVGRRSVTSDAPLIDRIQPPRDYAPVSRDYPPYRDEYARYPPPRDARYTYDYPPPPGREFRRPPTPPREYREYVAPVRASRDFDDYRARGPPPARYESRPGYYPPEADALPPPGYPPRAYVPPPRDFYDRYDRRTGPPPDRYAAYPAAAVRPRTPPGPPPRVREEFERPPAREYAAPAAEYRGRPTTPPPPVSRYADYPARAGSTEAPPVRYRRRSQSPPPRPAASSAAYDSGYPARSGGAYNGASNGYAGSTRDSGAGRDYPPPRVREAEPASYRRP